MTTSVASESLVCVYRAYDPILAGLAAECLQNNEIPVTRKEDARTMDGGYEVSVGMIELLVAEEHFTDASIALQKWEALRKAAASASPRSPISYKELAWSAGMQFVAMSCLFILMMTLGGFDWGRFIFWMILWLSGLVDLIRCGKVYAIWRHLRTMGYEWPTLDIACAVYYSLGRNAYSIPPAADVEMVPGFRRDEDGIYNFVICFNDYKREAARKRKLMKP